MSDTIPPDDKNWTWVLERACDDCGFSAAAFAAGAAPAALRDQVARWQAVLRRDDVRVRPRPDVWSPLEYSCHVRDVFRIFDERVRLMIETDEPRFANWDQDATAIQDRYDLQDPEAVAGELARACEALAARFESVTSQQWDRLGHRSDGATFTVDSLARYLLHDPIHHLWDVGAPVPQF